MKNSVKILVLIICVFNVLCCTKVEPNVYVPPPVGGDTIPDTIPDPDGEDIIPPKEKIRAVVVGEGQFGYGTGSLTTLSTWSNVAQDVFRKVNSRPLGDVPQSLVEIGDYYYIPVNNSRKVEVVDSKTFQSVETMVIDADVIPMFAVHLGGDSIVISDQSTSTTMLVIADINHGKERKVIRRHIDMGIQTSQMKVIDNKLFVGGSFLTVFDLDNLTLEGRRSVLNVTNQSFATCSFSKIVADKNGNLWVVTPSNISCIDVKTEKTIKEIYIPGINSWISCIDICPKGETVYVNAGGKVYAVDVDNSETPKEPIISHDNGDADWTTYSMSVSKENTIFLIRVLYGSITRGRVFEYSDVGEIVSYYKDNNGRDLPYFRAGIFPHFIHFVE